MTIHSFYLGTRVEQGKFGPQSQDMSLSDLIGLFRPVIAPTQYAFPDLMPLVQHINKQIKAEFAAQAQELREELRMQQYNTLYNAWTRAASYGITTIRVSAWEGVIDKAEAFLQALQAASPPQKTQDIWDDPFIDTIELYGHQYTEALLFIITARATLDPETLYRDVTLRDYCHWLRNWTKTYLTSQDRNNLLLTASIDKHENYLAVQVLSPNGTPKSADCFLAEHARKLDAQYVDKRPRTGVWYGRGPEKAKAMYRYLDTLEFYKQHWRMVFTLRDLLYRTDRLEAFLSELEQHGDSVAFDQQGNTTEYVNAFLKGDQSLLLPTLPEENENN